MSQYATNTDLSAEFPALSQNGGFTTTTKVTAAQVDEFCTRASNYIDAKLAGKWSMPVVAANSPLGASLLKELVCWRVFARVAPLMGITTGDAKSSNPMNKTDWGKKADDTLKEFQAGTMVFLDVPLATGTDGAESFTNDNSSTLQPPQFTRQGDNW